MEREEAQKEKEPLSRDAIISRALTIADEEGIENLSIRKLAGSMGRSAMSLYRHFGSIEEIRQGVVARVFSEVDANPIPGERWDDTIRRTTESIRQVELRHARAHLPLAEGAPWEPGLQPHTDRIQQLHLDQGIPEDILQKAWRIIDAFLTGFALNEMHEIEHARTLPQADERPSWFETVEAAYSEQAFRDGIEIIISGIRGLAAPNPCEWYTPQA